MPRKKKQLNLQPGDNSPLEGATVNVGSLDHLIDQAVAPLGNLSEADKLAIMGASVDTGMTASEMLAGHLEPRADQPPVVHAAPEEVAMGARVATLQARVDELTKAVERLAAGMTAAPTVLPHFAAPAQAIALAGPDEQATYMATNFALHQQGSKPHDGIQAWRNAGSPVLIPNKELPAKAGRAA